MSLLDVVQLTRSTGAGASRGLWWPSGSLGVVPAAFGVYVGRVQSDGRPDDLSGGHRPGEDAPLVGQGLDDLQSSTGRVGGLGRAHDRLALAIVLNLDADPVRELLDPDLERRRRVPDGVRCELGGDENDRLAHLVR